MIDGRLASDHQLMRIAIAGAGVSGLVAAHLLHPEHDVTVFEAGPYAGGHTNTIEVPTARGPLAVDTGFIVFNDRNYPRFEALLDSGLAGIDLDRSIRGADLVITAEGAIDFQTPRGKVPAEVARRASEQGVPVIGLAGTLGQGSDAVHGIGIDAVASILPVPMSLSEAVRDGEELLIMKESDIMGVLEGAVAKKKAA